MVVWELLNKRLVLPPECVALFLETKESVVQTIRQLGGVKLDQGQGSERFAKVEYEGLRRVLLEVDGEAMKTLTGTSSSCHPFSVY